MKKLNAYLVYLISEGVVGFALWLVLTIDLVYQATTVGLNPLQMLLIGTLFEATIFLFEIPTGIVADLYSRRLSVIVGVLLMGSGFIFEGLLPLYWALLLAHVILGIGETFISGAYQAWIADELPHANNGQNVSLGQVYLRGKQFNQLGGLIGIGVSVMLASLNLALPIVVGGVLYIGLGLFLVLFMAENGFSPTPPEERESWRAMGRTVKDGLRLVRVRPILLTILAISAIYGMAGEGFDRLWAPHLLANFSLPPLGQFEPVVWFGIIQAGGMLLTIGATEVARRKLNTDSHQRVVRVLIVANALLIGAVIVFGLSSGFIIALLAFWLVSVLRTTIDPVYIAWLNQNIDSKVRATMLSVNGLANSIGEAGGGPIIGAIGTFSTLRVALTVSGLILTPALVLYGRTLGKGQPAQTEVTAASGIED